MPRRIVLDTSAVIDGLDAAHPAWGEVIRDIQAEHSASAPAALASESGNVVHGRRREAFGATTEDRQKLLSVLLRDIELVPSDDGSRAEAGRLAESHGLTFYDAEFLELAARDDEGLLVTQDAKLLAAARKAIGAGRALSLDEAAEARRRGGL